MAAESTQLILASHGGQGVISMAEVLGTAITREGRYCVCHMIYGAEMRGGIVRCYVTIADSEPPDLFIERAEGVLCMNQEAWDHEHDSARPGGFVVANADLVAPASPSDPSVRLVRVACNALAEKAGSARTVSMVGLGALLGLADLVSVEQIELALQEVLPERHHKLIPVNLTALQAGMEAAQESVPALQ